MVILALDSSTRASSCAVARDGVVLAEEMGDSSRPPAARLPGDLIALLAHAGVALDAVDLFAVVTGPGSFTGLRVGIATMQGLAFATGRPLVGISGFDALAHLAGDGAVATWVDAWRGEVYGARYDDGVAVQAPTVASPDAWLDTVPSASARVTFIGDGAAQHRAAIVRRLGTRAAFADPVAPSLAGAVARLAAASAERPAPHAIRPLYVRRPDAELARGRQG